MAQKAVAGAGTLTAAIRELILREGNKPVKISSLYDRLRSLEAFKDVSRTHIKEKVIRGMVLRDEVIRAPVQEIDAKGRTRSYYAMRLKVNGALRRRTAGLGISLPTRDATAAADAAAKLQ